MSEVTGKLIGCARCDSMIFLKLLEKVDMDGGYSHYDKYQNLPKSWIYDSHFGYLCPDCAGFFADKMNEFFMGRPLAPAWIPEHDDKCTLRYINLYRLEENEDEQDHG